MFGNKLADKAGCTPDDDIELLRGGCHEYATGADDSTVGTLCRPHSDYHPYRLDILPALKREDSPKGIFRLRVSSGFKDAFA